MTTHELAKQLLTLPDVPVMVRGYESGVNIVSMIQGPREYRLNSDGQAWYYGQYEFCDDTDNGIIGTAVYLTAE